MGEDLPEPKPLSSHDKRELKKQQKQTQSQQQSSVAIDTNKKKRTKVYIISVIIILAAAFALWKIPGGITASTTVDVVIGDHPVVGAAGSPVQVVVFGDFQCPFTKRLWGNAFPKILEEYKDEVQVAFWPVPTARHNYDRESAEAAYCAGEQGKFWEYADILFARQGSARDADLRDYARELDLDVSAFSLCYSSGKYKAKVDQDYKAGKKLGVVQTPTVAINGYWLSGELSFEDYRTFIEYELKNG